MNEKGGRSSGRGLDSGLSEIEESECGFWRVDPAKTPENMSHKSALLTD